VDAGPDAGGAIRAVQPDVDEPELTLHPPGEREDTLEIVAEEKGAAGTTVDPHGGPIGGVFCTAMCEIFYRTPAGYTADRKTRRKRNVGCYELLSASCHPNIFGAIVLTLGLRLML
jgi:hypothetical protein